MSSSTENRWRRTSQAGPPRTQNPASRDRSGASTPKERQSTGPNPGNAWGGHERNKSVAATQAQNQDGAKAAKGPATPTGSGVLGGDEHTSVRGFEGAATREWMKRGYQSATAGLDPKALLWRPSTDAAGGAKTGGAWGRKPNTMASGQDFWVQLRRELKNAEQGK